MIIQAELRRKQSEYEGEACSVDKVIELPAQRFKQFSRALLADYDFIAENKNAIRHDEDARHCLLILDADGTDGFLVDPQGYNYARYSAFVPNARSLLTLDMGIDRSYLSPVEPWRNENRDEMLRMTLRVEGKPDYTLVLPADEEYLDAVKAYHFFTMGGAKSHDTEDGILEPGAPDFERKLLMLQRKPRARYRINHISWWAQEMPSEEEYAEARKNLAKVDWAVDYVITHCAPTSIALMENRHNEADPLTDFLQEVKERAHYHYWLFGHYHDNRAIDEKHILLWEQIIQVI